MPSNPKPRQWRSRLRYLFAALVIGVVAPNDQEILRNLDFFMNLDVVESQMADPELLANEAEELDALEAMDQESADSNMEAKASPSQEKSK